MRYRVIENMSGFNPFAAAAAAMEEGDLKDSVMQVLNALPPDSRRADSPIASTSPTSSGHSARVTSPRPRRFVWYQS